MPTYEYRCTACRHAWERFQSIKADPERTCPKCGKPTAQRQVGIGIGILTGGRASESSDAAASATKPADATAAPAKNGTAATTPSKAEVTPQPAAAPKEAKAADAGKVNATHPAREGRGAGNLRDTIRRQRKSGGTPRRGK